MTERKKPEDEAKHKISQWMYANRYEIFWEKKNEYGWKTFKTIGLQSKPDILFRYVDNPTFCGVIEMKTAITSANLRKATTQILEYYTDYAKGRIKYYVDNKEMNVRLFVIGTPYSPIGCLYHDDVFDEHTNKQLIDMKKLPPFEGMKTNVFFRGILDMFKGSKKNPDLRELGLLVGILISSRCSNPKITLCSPHYYCSVPFTTKKTNKLTSRIVYFSEDNIKTFY